MAQETKIGLLTGLAFIICFAVILTNRGRDHLVTMEPSWSTINQTQTATGRTATGRAAAPASSAGRLINNNRWNVPAKQPPTGARQAAESPVPHAPSTRSAATPPQQERADVTTNEKEKQPAKHDRQERQELERIERNLRHRIDELEKRYYAEKNRKQTPPLLDQKASVQLAAEESDLPKRIADMVVSRQQDTSAQKTTTRKNSGKNAGRKPAAVNARSAQTRKRTSASKNQPSPPGNQDAVVYKVKSGDTLSRIAGRAYGSQSRKMVDAIYDANRGTIPGIDRLRAGIEIVLPVIDGTKPTGEASKGKASRKPGRKSLASTSQTGTIRDYVIKKNDRYITIARDQLGDAERWREIYELNKKKFPKPNMIVVGATIQLPTTTVADSSRSQR